MSFDPKRLDARLFAVEELVMDPFRMGSSSTLASTLASARASLLHPRRPETPGEDPRLLLTLDESSRPSTGKSDAGGPITRNLFSRGSSFTEADYQPKVEPSSVDEQMKPKQKPKSRGSQGSSPEPEYAIMTAATQRSASVGAARPSTADLNELKRDISKKEKTSQSSNPVPRSSKKSSSGSSSTSNNPSSQGLASQKGGDGLPPKPKSSSSRQVVQDSAMQKESKQGGQGELQYEVAQQHGSASPQMLDIDETRRILTALQHSSVNGKTPLDELSELSQIIKGGENIPVPEKSMILETLLSIVTNPKDARASLRASVIILRICQGSEECMQLVGDRMFGLSTEKGNDILFIEEKVIVPIVTMLPRLNVKSENKVLVLLVGVLKNVSNEERSQVLLSQQGGISILNTLLLRSLKDESEGTLPLRDAIRLILQVAATLRNLSLISSHRKQFSVFKVIQNLCVAASRYYKYEKLMMCISRVLAKLTMSPECRAAMSEKGSYILSLFKLLEMYPKNTEIVLRTTFTLGSLTAYNDENRTIIASDEQRLVLIFGIFKYYFDHTAPSGAELQQEAGAKKEELTKNEKEETLISVTRLIANLGISSKFAPRIAAMSHVSLLKKALVTRKIQDHEEFILNVVAVVTNLSYFETPDNIVLLEVDEYSKLLVPILFFDNEEGLVEAIRAFGNFSRSPEGRASMKASRATDAITILLDHSNIDVLSACCGVLMNLSSDPEHRAHIIHVNCIDRLISILTTVGIDEPQLSSRACKILYNINLSQPGGIFSGEQNAMLDGVLEEMLSDMNDVQQAELSTTEQEELSELKDVVQTLKSILDSAPGLVSRSGYQCDLEPLEYPVDEDYEDEDEDEEQLVALLSRD